MKEKLTKREFASVSVMLFGLFFGAGNLIFPPLLGQQAGKLAPLALMFFTITAVVFPVLGVVAVAKTHGLDNLAGRVGPLFAVIYTSLIYLSIGPGLGIPRAGSVPFELAVAPNLSASADIFTARLIYTLIFFMLAFIISLKPNKLVSRLGKFLTPILLVLITLMFFGLLLNNPNQVGESFPSYANNAEITGFLDGYNTMDAIAALNFGLVISLAITSFNIKEKSQVVSYTVKAGLVAGLLLFIVYGMLTFVGMYTAELAPKAENGAEILLASGKYVFGTFGTALLIAIFTLACLTTCVGLITSGSQYFSRFTKGKINYTGWVVIWSVFSFFVANFGLNTILKISVPVLVSIYPISLVLIIMALLHKYFSFGKLTYKSTIYVVAVISIAEGFKSAKINLPFLGIIEKLPLFYQSLGWVIPGFFVMILMTIVEKLLKSNKA